MSIYWINIKSQKRNEKDFDSFCEAENLEEAGKNFYDYLHILDNSQCNGIAVAPIPNHNLGKTINDRLKRASKN